jgi:hypothetical protein
MTFEKFDMPVPGKDHTRPAIKEVSTGEVVCLCKDDAWRDIVLASLKKRFDNA